MRKAKIVQINAVYGEKSTGLIVQDLDGLLQDMGESSFVVYNDARIAPANGICIKNRIGQKYHAFRSRVDGKQSYSSRFSTLALIKKLEIIKPDILHLHNIHSNFLNLPTLIKYAKKNRIAVLLTLHDCWFFTGKCKTECNNCPKRYTDIPSRLRDSSRQVFRGRCRLFNYDRLYVVGCSSWITEMARQSPILKKAKFSTIYNGIDTDIFSPIDEKEENQPFTVVTMANKWFETENEEVRSRVLQFLEGSGRLIIIGCSEKNQQLYVGDNRVQAIGYVRDRKELAATYAKGNAFLNLTHIDNLPTVNMEAASCGIPVITYDVGGSGELVKDSFTGYKVKVDDVDGIITALDRVRQGNISKKNCRNYATSHFDKKNNYKKYMTLYQDIVNEMEDTINEPSI